MSNNQNFCARLWHGIEINADGTARPCCFFSGRVQDGNRDMNVATDSIDSIRNSTHLKQLRQQFLKGGKPSECRQCWTEEAVGRNSERTNSNQRLYNTISSGNINYTDLAENLKLIGVALGNICNLRCRICGPWASSSWNADEIKFLTRENLAGTLEERMLTQGAWPLHADQFWDQFAQAVCDVDELKIYGGEPFMIPKHLEVLDFLVKNKYSRRIKLVYNTNGTHYPEQASELWSKFRSVELSLSIDNIGKKFEYERKNARWDQVIDNLEKFKQIQATNRNFRLQCTTTVSVYNILDLVDIAVWIDQQGFYLPTFWNILQFSEHHSIIALSDKNKTHIQQYLTARLAELNHQTRLSINNVIDYMINNSAPSLETQLVQEIQRVDRFRNEYLGDSHPELARLLNYHRD